MVAIQTQTEYETALERLSELWDAKPNTRDGKERDILFRAIAAYEAEHYPVDEPESYAAVAFHLERLNLTVEGLPISEDAKTLLKKCLAQNILIPDWLLDTLSKVLGVEREVLGIADVSKTDARRLHSGPNGSLHKTDKAIRN